MRMTPGRSVVPMLLVLAGPLAATGNNAQPVPREIFQTGIARLGSLENTMTYDLNAGKQLWRTCVHGAALHRPMHCKAHNSPGEKSRRWLGSAFVAIPDEEQNDSKTAKLLWQFKVGAGCHSAPITFTHGGEQFVAVARGGNFQLTFPLGGAVQVFGLPKARK